MASKTDHVIGNAVVFDNLRDAVSDLNHVLATTARARDSFKPVASAVEAVRALRLYERRDEKSGILFGRERFGLSNEEMSLADEIVTFPVNPAFASLNIVQAVLLMSYEWMKTGLEDKTQTVFRGSSISQAEKKTLHGFLPNLRKCLMCVAISVRRNARILWWAICVPY